MKKTSFITELIAYLFLAVFAVTNAYFFFWKFVLFISASTLTDVVRIFLKKQHKQKKKAKKALLTESVLSTTK